MSIISLVLILVLIGLAAWVINSLIPMGAGIKKVLNVALVVIAILICLSAFGILGDIRGAKVPQL